MCNTKQKKWPESSFISRAPSACQYNPQTNNSVKKILSGLNKCRNIAGIPEEMCSGPGLKRRKNRIGISLYIIKRIFSLDHVLRITHKNAPTLSNLFSPLLFDIGVEFLPHVKWIWLFCLLALSHWLRTEMKGLLALGLCQGDMPQLTAHLHGPNYSCIFRRQQLRLQTSQRVWPCTRVVFWFTFR